MKNIFLSWLLILSVNFLTAQYVLIPDTAFGSLLHSDLPTCVIGSSSSAWLLDTTCSVMSSFTDLEIYTSKIASLEGVQYLRNLTTLSFSISGISHLPALPPHLQFLNCALNYLDSLPSLPSSLTYLDCEVCNLYQLPLLPAGLKTLICQDNHLSNLPNVPDSMKYLGCAQNSIVSLPILPHSLETLDCRYNQLTTLPELPTDLSDLACSNNLLTTLPILPNFLQTIDCSNNHITSLPSLPDTLLSLNCANNPNLNCMPYMGVVETLLFSNTAISCFPDTPKNNTSITANLPICTSACFAATSVQDAVKSKLDFSLYPNPTTSKLKIELPVLELSHLVQIIILNSTGQKVYKQMTTVLNDFEVDVSILLPGLYIMEVQDKNEYWTKKFVKE